MEFPMQQKIARRMTQLSRFWSQLWSEMAKSRGHKKAFSPGCVD